MTTAIAHCRHHHPSQLRCHPAVHWAVATVTHRGWAAIMPPCVTSWRTAAPQHAGWLSCWTGCHCITSCRANTSQCAGWLSHCLLIHHHLVCPGWFLHHLAAADELAHYHLASHHAIFSFAPPGCPSTPCCANASNCIDWLSRCLSSCHPLIDLADWRITLCHCHHHPSQSRRQPTIHCAVSANAHCNCAANIKSHCVNVLPSFPLLPPTIMAIAMQHITIALPSHTCCTTFAGADAAAAAAAAGTAAAVSAATTGSSLRALPPHETSWAAPCGTAQDSHPCHQNRGAVRCFEAAWTTDKSPPPHSLMHPGQWGPSLQWQADQVAEDHHSQVTSLSSTIHTGNAGVSFSSNVVAGGEAVS